MQPGDNLSRIAAQMGFSLCALEAANPQLGPTAGRSWSRVYTGDVVHRPMVEAACPVEPAPTPTPPAARKLEPAIGTSAWVLADGRLLVAGGLRWDGQANVVVTTTQVVDPRTWSVGDAGALLTGHYLAGETLLKDGSPLIVGGFGPGLHSSADAEVYDVAAGAWRSAGQLAERRINAAVVTLQDGRVLVVGGYNNIRGPLASTEIYTPATNTWVSGPPLSLARSGPTATVLHDGRVLVAGGDSRSIDASTAAPVTNAEIWDPRGGGWSVTAPLLAAISEHSAAILFDGRVLVAGQGGAEIYSPSTATWSSVPGWLPIRSTTLARLEDGRVLAAGGMGPPDMNTPSSSAALYVPAQNAWTTTAAMTQPRWVTTSVVLPDGRVAVIGGQSGLGTDSLADGIDVYDPTSATWQRVAA